MTTARRAGAACPSGAACLSGAGRVPVAGDALGAAVRSGPTGRSRPGSRAVRVGVGAASIPELGADRLRWQFMSHPVELVILVGVVGGVDSGENPGLRRHPGGRGVDSQMCSSVDY